MGNNKLEVRREELLAAAGNVFAAKGFAATKISDIAQAAGISQGLMYRYFSSKDALFCELIRGSFAKLNDAALGLEQAPLPPHAKIAKALREIIGSMTASASFPNRVLLIAQASISEGIPAKAKKIMAAESPKPYAVIARIMAAGQQAGTILPGDPAELATLFWTTIKGIALHRVAQGAAFAAPDWRLIGRLFFAGEAPLSADTSTAPAPSA
jgi:AcrR family transcriptional regulator